MHFLKTRLVTVIHSSEMWMLILWDEVIFYYSYVALAKNIYIQIILGVYIYSNHPFLFANEYKLQTRLNFFPHS